MKPRFREPQGQSARLFLRTKDHRDVIYNDTYHNMIWANTTDINDKLVWKKYPNHGLMYAHAGMGWLDADRQLSYGAALGGGTYGASVVHRFDDPDNDLHYAVAHVQKRNFRLTEDGIVFKSFNPNISCPNFGSYKFAKNGLYSNQYANQAHVTYFNKDEDTETWSLTHRTYDISSIATFPRVMGYTDDGILLIREVVNNGTYTTQWYRYLLDKDGQITMLSDPVPSASKKFLQYSVFQGLKIGIRNFFVLFNRYRNWTSQEAAADTYKNSLIAMVSNDDGVTWNEVEIFSYDDGYGSGFNSANKLNVFSRDGVVYIICGQVNPSSDGHSAYDVRMFESRSGQSWDEIELPKWVDVPLLNVASGVCINPSVSDTIRVAISPSQTTDANARMFDLVPQPNSCAYEFDYGSYNMMFSKGEPTNKTDEDFYLCLGTDSLHLFFDNKYFAENSKAFAFYKKDYSANDNLADTLQPQDYCVRGE